MHIEDMTLRQLSERVIRQNNQEDLQQAAIELRWVRATSDAIAKLCGLPEEDRYHDFLSYGNEHIKSCVKCPYPQEHTIHHR